VRCVTRQSDLTAARRWGGDVNRPIGQDPAEKVGEGRRPAGHLVVARTEVEVAGAGAVRPERAGLGRRDVRCGGCSLHGLRLVVLRGGLLAADDLERGGVLARHARRVEEGDVLHHLVDMGSLRADTEVAVNLRGVLVADQAAC
jgi:hypothetical protein